jgi:hypothetical protein
VKSTPSLEPIPTLLASSIKMLSPFNLWSINGANLEVHKI